MDVKDVPGGPEAAAAEPGAVEVDVPPVKGVQTKDVAAIPVNTMGWDAVYSAARTQGLHGTTQAGDRLRLRGLGSIDRAVHVVSYM